MVQRYEKSGRVGMHLQKLPAVVQRRAMEAQKDVAAAFADNLERYERGGVEALREGGATFDWEAGY